MRRRLKTLEPIILPNAISPLPLTAAAILVTSSGRDVPAARMVTEMNLSLMPAERAMFTAESTKSSPPPINATRPGIIITTANTVEISGFSPVSSLLSPHERQYRI